MATGNTIVTDALLEIGVGSPGENGDQEIENHALRVLNRMWESWSAELMPVYQHVLDSLTWTSGSQSMTIGATGDLAVTRPIEIVSMQGRVNNVDWTIDPISFEAFQQLTNKSETSLYPDFYCYDGTYPNGTIYMWRIPNANMTIRISSKKAMTAFTLAGTVALPEGYEKALVTNLAVELANTHGKSARSELVNSAINSKRTIVNINDQSTDVYPDPGIPGLRTYNYPITNA